MENKTCFEQLNVEIGLAKEEDLADILRLQQENLGQNISEAEKEKQGFVSLETPEKLLREILDQEGITVARINGKVVGYLMPMSVEQCKQALLLHPFIEKFETVKFENKPLNEYRYCILGQVCVDKQYRGKGILEKLYEELKSRLAKKYDIGISEIGANNPRSLHVHLDKLGFKITEQYTAQGKDWYIVTLDFRPFKK